MSDNEQRNNMLAKIWLWIVGTISLSGFIGVLIYQLWQSWGWFGCLATIGGFVAIIATLAAVIQLSPDGEDI